MKKKNFDKKKLLIISQVCLLIIILVLTYTLFRQQMIQKDSDKSNIEKSIDKGMTYLNKNFQEPYFYEEVLNWFYDNNPPEVWQYGKIDISTNFIYVKDQFKDYSIIKSQQLKAETYLKEVAKRMWNATIDTTYLAYGNPVENFTNGDYALDTTCIVGGLFNDSKIAANVYKNLRGNDWAYVDLHNPYIGWRAIADESWCISLLITNRYPKELIKTLWDTKLDESFAYMNDENIFASRKYGGLMHTLLMYKVLLKNGYLDEGNELYLGKDYKEEINLIYNKEIDLLDDSEVYSDPVNLGNTIYILALYEYGKEDNYSKLLSMSDKLLEMQKSDGSWKVYDPRKQKEVIPAFSTLRAIVGLNMLNTRLEESEASN